MIFSRVTPLFVTASLLFGGLASAENAQLNTASTAYTPKGQKVSVVLTRGITRSDQLPPNLARARKALSAKSELRLSTLRALADHADGNAAFQFAKKLDFAARPSLADDAAHYYGIAAATGRGGAIYGFVRALDAIDPAQTSDTRLNNLRAILIAYANAGSAPALEAMLRYHIKKAPFADLSADLERLALQSKGPASDAIALQLASEIINSKTTDAGQLEQAQLYLQSLQDTESLRLRLISENLMPLVQSQIASLPQEEIAQ